MRREKIRKNRQVTFRKEYIWLWGGFGNYFLKLSVLLESFHILLGVPKTRYYVKNYFDAMVASKKTKAKYLSPNKRFTDQIKILE